MKENVIEINSANYDAAYAMADEQTRKVLAVLCGRSDETTAPAKPAPTLSDYTTIRSYEDACVALGIEPTLNKSLIVRNGDSVEDLFELPKHIVAQMKLETICRALWGGEVKVYPDPKGERTYWYPWFALYTKDEMERMNKEQRGALLSAAACTGAFAGFGSLYANNRSSYSHAYSGFRLCLDTEEKAEYFGKQFVELWAEAIAFNFTVGEHITE